MSAAPADAALRSRALDPASSFLVQAPAGSGKTELLVQRFLALLACVDAPEEILAITFTRKAAAEMKSRVAAALAEAAHADAEDVRARLARAALARSRALGWELDKNPSRLNVTTIDGFSRSLVARMPWLARTGAPPDVAQHPEELYLEAVRRVFAHLEEGDDFARALARVLEHFDNRADRFRQLLVDFLAGRDRWLLRRSSVRVERDEMERALEELLSLELAFAAQALAPHGAQIAALGAYVGAQRQGHPLSGLETLPAATGADVAAWRELSALFLTKDGEFRKQVTKREGFPADAPDVKLWKQRFADLVETLSAVPHAKEALARVRDLPDAAYGETWEIVAPLLKVLDLALASLWQVMRDEARADFSEIARRGLEALRDAPEPSELLLALDRRLRHLLVDEFQDTSRVQFDLLERLVSGWTPGDGRTLFLVGDPMQSIYRFREAEVTLFAQAARAGVGPVSLETLTLTANFRSSPSLVAWFNHSLPRMFPAREDLAEAAVPYTPCVAERGEDYPDAVRFYSAVGDEPRREAAQVGDEAVAALSEGSVAVLARSRAHLTQILAEFTRRGIPWRGEDLAYLGERAAVRDIRSLAAALLDPADRLAWLSVLRAPWCGLTLADLHALAAGDARPIPQMVEEGVRNLSPDGAVRLAKTWSVLRPALAGARRKPFRPWLEGAWIALGGPSLLDAGELRDAAAALDLLESLEEGGNLPAASRLDREFFRLFSRPDASAMSGAAVEVMTIHKAKGLQFDTVLLPGLGRRTRGSAKPLLAWEQAPSEAIVLAPAPPRMKKARSPILDYLTALAARKDANETVRLLYVAVTRAKRRLRLWGSVSPAEDFAPKSRTLLALLWPVVASEFSALSREPHEEPPKAARPLAVLRADPGWFLPPLPPCPVATSAVAAKAGEGEELEFRWAREERKHIGTVGHRLLERIAREGVEAWNDARIESQREATRRRLSALGVSDVAGAADEVLRAARNTLADPKGRWILATREGAASEWGLSGLDDGEPVTGIMDRTFLDGGSRWIVDFKFTPHEGGDLESFLAEQAERHRPQLARYARLARLHEPGLDVRAGLYFPLLMRFVEVKA